MKREDCWMTFSEALEQYLRARDALCTAPVQSSRRQEAEENMQVAAEHMDALTQKDTP